MTLYSKKTTSARRKTLKHCACKNCGMPLTLGTPPNTLCMSCARNNRNAPQVIERQSGECVTLQQAIEEGAQALGMLPTDEGKLALAEITLDVAASWRYDDWREFLTILRHDLPQEMRDLLPDTTR